MPDLLVPLYRLPAVDVPDGMWVGVPLPHRSGSVLDYIGRTFSREWMDEASVAFCRTPPTMKVVVFEDTGSIEGFCCWDCTAKGFLGPVGVSPERRGSGAGRSVVLSVLHSMRESGYAYAVIGGAGPVEFFQRICDARVIEGSEPGIYGTPLK